MKRILLLTVIIVWVCSSSIFAQTQNTVKEVNEITFDDAPIEIIGIENSQRLFKLNEKFIQDKDWLKDLTIKLKNKSSKTITYLEIELNFPETKLSGNIMSFPLIYDGRNPLSIAKNENERIVKSEATFKLILTEEEFTKLKSFIETRHLLNSLNKMDISIVFVVFDDVTVWSKGYFLQPDPKNPKKFVPMSSKEWRKNG